MSKKPRQSHKQSTSELEEEACHNGCETFHQEEASFATNQHFHKELNKLSTSSRQWLGIDS